MKYFVVDVFTDQVFRGNPAGVCLVDEPLSAELMQSIAAENNLAETAFVSRNGEDFDLRWFTPVVEMDLCGHATLASAYVISHFLDQGRESMNFNTASGKLSVSRVGDRYTLDMPKRAPAQIPVTQQMEEAIGARVLEAHQSRDLMLVLENEAAVQNLAPRMDLLRKIPDAFGVIVTARGDSVDFVSRFFVTNEENPEDPVTGSSHATLIPYWAERLGKADMSARQLSKRGGQLECVNGEDRVTASGTAVLYLVGEMYPAGAPEASIG